MTSAVVELPAGISADLRRRLPAQRKTQRDKLALLVAIMLDARSANLMVLAASLPRQAERADMRYKWIVRFIDIPLVGSDEVMEPFAREVLTCAASDVSVRSCFQLPTSLAARLIPRAMSVRRVSPRHMTMLPGGGSLLRLRYPPKRAIFTA